MISLEEVINSTEGEIQQAFKELIQSSVLQMTLLQMTYYTLITLQTKYRNLPSFYISSWLNTRATTNGHAIMISSSIRLYSLKPSQSADKF